MSSVKNTATNMWPTEGGAETNRGTAIPWATSTRGGLLVLPSWKPDIKQSGCMDSFRFKTNRKGPWIESPLSLGGHSPSIVSYYEGW